MVSESDGQRRSYERRDEAGKRGGRGIKTDEGWGRVMQVCLLSTCLHICGRHSYR